MKLRVREGSRIILNRFRTGGYSNEGQGKCTANLRKLQGRPATWSGLRDLR
jgi:hypothetical protein